MDLLSEALQFGSNPGVCYALSEFVMCCVDDCPLAVEALLQVESYVSLMVASMQKALQESTSMQNWKLSSHSYVTTIAAMCLACVITQPDHSSRPIQTCDKERVGAVQILKQWQSI